MIVRKIIISILSALMIISATSCKPKKQAEEKITSQKEISQIESNDKSNKKNSNTQKSEEENEESNSSKPTTEKPQENVKPKSDNNQNPKDVAQQSPPKEQKPNNTQPTPQTQPNPPQNNQPIPQPEPAPQPQPSPQPTPQPQPTPEPTPPAETFNIEKYISYAKSYAQSIGLTLNSSAVECWDNPISANQNSKYIESNIQSRLNRYKMVEGFTQVWIWAEEISENNYNLYIGYA